MFYVNMCLSILCMYLRTIFEAMNISFDIPVKPYIYQHFLNHYGDPWLAQKKTQEGNILYKLLEKQEQRNNKKFKGYDFLLTVKLSEDMHFRYGSFMTDHNIIQFNKEVADHIRYPMRIYIETLVSTGEELKKACQAAQHNFGFSEDYLPWDTIQRDVLRHRQYNNSTKEKMSVRQKHIPQTFKIGKNNFGETVRT